MSTFYEFRPIREWPGTLLDRQERKASPFSAGYNTTLRQLSDELDYLKARDVVIELAIEEAELRIDGMLRANANPAHPGVILSFDSMHGPLRYFTDRFDDMRSATYRDGWKANLRAVTLGLEALRKVDRYAITKRGEQYTGWSALPPATPMGPTSMTLDDAIAYLDSFSTGEWDFDDDEAVEAAYREAAKVLHPDVGGDTASFQRLDQARRVILGAT